MEVNTNKEEIDLAKNMLAQIKELRAMDGNGNKTLNDQLLGVNKLEDLKRKADRLVDLVEEKYRRENPRPEYVYTETTNSSSSNTKKRKIVTNKTSSTIVSSSSSAAAAATVSATISKSVSPPSNVHAKGKPLCAVLVEKEWILGYIISEIKVKGKGDKSTYEVADYDNNTQKYTVPLKNMIKLIKRQEKWMRWQKIYAWFPTTTTFYRGKIYQDIAKQGICKVIFEGTPATDIYEIDRLFIIEDQN